MRKKRTLFVIFLLGMAVYIGILNFVVCAQSKNDFLYVQGTKIYNSDNTEFQIRAINLNNSISAVNTPSEPMKVSTTENTYKEVAEMGFNAVRFLVNYQIFEDDNNPYVYKDTGWDWINQNIKWAKKYNIKIIINMHVPQGGYQSLGEGMAIWDKSNQDRLINLWRMIAKRYADESIIIGFGLVNEPQVAKEDDLYLWNDLANNIVKAIREVDKKHICFVEPCGVWKGSGYLYPTILSDNIVYEKHVYPFNNIKTLRKTANNDFDYGNGSIVFIPEEEKLPVTTFTSKTQLKSTNSIGKWTTITNVIEVPEGVNAAYLKMGIGALKRNVVIYMRNICVYEFNEKNELQGIVYNSNNNHGGTYNKWSRTGNVDSKITVTYDEEIGMVYFEIQNEDDYLDFADDSVFKYFSVTPHYKYLISYDVFSNDAISSNTFIMSMLNCVDSPNQYFMDKSYLKELFGIEALEEELGFPVFIGEIGFTRDELDYETEGYHLLSDCIDILLENNYHFAYFTYHSSTHGLYTSPYYYVDNVNKRLKDIFIKKLK